MRALRLSFVAQAALGFCPAPRVGLAPPSSCRYPGRGRVLHDAHPISRCRRRRSLPGAPLVASSAVEGGVELPPIESAEEDAKFLARAIRLHLDEEWMPLGVHRAIGDRVGAIYRAARAEGASELTDVVMETGSALERFDMGDAFVNGWDVANLVADFMLARLGRANCECNTPLPSGMVPHGVAAAAAVAGAAAVDAAAGSGTAAAAADTAAAAGASAGTGTGAAAAASVAASAAASAPARRPPTAEELAGRLGTEFDRYRFLADFLDEIVGWEEMNVVLAVNLGFLPLSMSAAAPGPPRAWAAAFSSSVAAVAAATAGDAVATAAAAALAGSGGEVGAGSMAAATAAPDFATSAAAGRLLAAELPDAPDAAEGLEDFISTAFGEEAKRMAEETGDAAFTRRSLAVKWLYMRDFLKRPLSAAPPPEPTDG